MRFAIFIFLALWMAQAAFASPGDKIDAQSKGFNAPATKRQALTNDIPVAPEGFVFTKSVSNLGEIVALTVIGKDVFVADTGQDRLLRLKSRNANNVFETRAEFLIGFDKINGLASDSEWLFMSDDTGIWKIDAGNTLTATKAPKLLYPNSVTNKKRRSVIAMHPKEQVLFVGTGNCVFALNTTDGSRSDIACGQWVIEDIAVSPTGSVWASVRENGMAYIIPIRKDSENVARLKLPPNSTASNIRFWNNEAFPDDWPTEWASDLIISIQGNRPMLARAHFNFGDIAPDFTILANGFSTPSRFIGRREYWGVPMAMAVLANGQLIFAEREQGALWVLEKKPDTFVEPAPAPITPESSEPEPVKDKKPVFPELLSGSSIKSASGLETDELLKAQTPGMAEEKQSD